MNKILNILTSVFLIVLNADAGQENKNLDVQYRSKIIGNWKQVIDNGSVKLEATNSYFKNGLFSSQATLYLGDKKKFVVISGTWEIKGGILTLTLKKTNLPKMFPIGLTSKDKIIEINDEIFKYKTKRGTVRIHTRIKDGKNKK